MLPLSNRRSGDSCQESPKLSDSFSESESPVISEIDDNSTLSSKTHSINVLPPEILLKVFGLLDPLTLNNIWKVCKRWKQLVQTKEIWYQSFSHEFNTVDAFPSISNSTLWILEYEDRLRARKKWFKSRTTYQYYKFMERFASISSLTVDFNSKRVYGLTESGEYGSCNLINGKNYVFIPNRPRLTHKLPKYNQRYLIQIDAEDDAIRIKNLQAARSSGSSAKSSIRCDYEGEVHEICLDIDDCFDQNHEFDFVSGDASGQVKCWTFKGKKLVSYELSTLPIVFVKSDYKNKLIAIDSNHTVFYINRDEKKTYTFKLPLDEYLQVHYDYYTSGSSKCWIEVDFGFDKLSFLVGNQIIVVDYIAGKVFKSISLPSNIKFGALQTMKARKLNKFDPSLVGSDAIMYGTLLEDNSLFVWNIRDSRLSSDIIPQCHIKLARGLRDEPTCMALNSLVIVLGYRNGFSEVRDLYTGEYIRSCTKDFPGNFENHYQGLSTQKVILNPDPLVTNGIVVTYDLIQYFQLGSLPAESENKKRSKQKRTLNHQKPSIRNIKVELDEYEYQEEERLETKRLVDKFNGDFIGDDNDDEISLAIAVSASQNETTHSDLTEEEQLKLALEMSLQTSNSDVQDSHQTETTIQDADEFSKQLEEALKISLADS